MKKMNIAIAACSAMLLTSGAMAGGNPTANVKIFAFVDVTYSIDEQLGRQGKHGGETHKGSITGGGSGSGIGMSAAFPNLDNPDMAEPKRWPNNVVLQIAGSEKVTIETDKSLFSVEEVLKQNNQNTSLSLFGFNDSSINNYHCDKIASYEDQGLKTCFKIGG